MPKKNDIDEMKGRLARLNERTKSAEDGLKSWRISVRKFKI